MKKKTCLMMGGSGMAGGWIHNFVEHFSDRIEIVGLADVNTEVLASQSSALGLSEDQIFTDYREAVEKVKADFCGVATPPQFHSPMVLAAMEAGMPVICEKPIAESLDAALAMVTTAKETGLPCAIIQNYRYAPDKQEARRIVDEGRLGRLQHIIGRYACDYRRPNSWGKEWRHAMDFPLLFEGSVHHMDMLRFLSAGDCQTLVGFGWNPEWSSFRHESSAMYTLRMNNGVHCFYEGNSSAAGIMNCWHNEHYRLEFEEGTLEIAGGNNITIHRTGQDSETYKAPEIEWHGHLYLFDEFLKWLDGGEPSATRIEDNIKSFTVIIAAMETSQDGEPRNVPEYCEGLGL